MIYLIVTAALVLAVLAVVGIINYNKLNDIRAVLAVVIRKEDTIMATLDQIAADMTEETTLIDGISTLITGLKQQLTDALAGTTLPPAVQAQVDAIFTTAEANKAKLAAAAVANTPAATAAVSSV